MKNIIYSIICFSLLGLASCDPLDNYTTPEHTLQGTLTDALTGEPLITTPGNFIFALKEVSFSEDAPIRTYPGNKGGTYMNTKLFNATYELELRNGNFVPPPVETVEVNGTVVKDFTVMPYMGVTNVTTSRSDSTLTVNWNIVRHVETEDLTNTLVFLSKYPEVSDQIREKWGNFGGLWNLDPVEVLAKDYSWTFEELDPNMTYYIKIASRSRLRPNSTVRKYNWTETITID